LSPRLHVNALSNYEEHYVRIGIDLGGTKTVIALSDSGDELFRHRQPTPRDYHQTLDLLVSLVALTEKKPGKRAPSVWGSPALFRPIRAW
jgi:fructokinase